jgi:hypothetical protein
MCRCINLLWFLPQLPGTEKHGCQNTAGALLATRHTDRTAGNPWRVSRSSFPTRAWWTLLRYLWLPLLNLVITLRAGRSAAAYRQIWWPEGSLVLTGAWANACVPRWRQARVEVGMRYGARHRDGLERLRPPAWRRS